MASAAAGFERKERWKERPGNRYSPEQLRAMSEQLDHIRILESEFEVMRIN